MNASLGDLSPRDKAVVRFALRIGAHFVCDQIEKLVAEVPPGTDARQVLQAAVNAARETTDLEWPEHEA